MVNGRVNVWTRKSFKKSFNIIEDMKYLNELEYYLTDNYKFNGREKEE
jgi:hypothetical protein